MVYIDMGGTLQYEITELWAYCVHGPKGEGLAGYFDPVHGWIPLVGADKTRVKLYDAMAQKIATESGQTVVCKKLSKVEIVKTFKPEKK